MINKVILMGRLTRDPELRYTQNNISVAAFTLAIDRGTKNQNGEKLTDFINCVAWRKSADFVKQWFTKGMMAIVEGRIQSRAYEDKHGNKRTATEVIVEEMRFGETKKARDVTGASAYYAPPNIMPDDNEFTDYDDGDVPF